MNNFQMNDAMRRPLQIPPWQIPYLEKHRIFELFNELSRELIIRQPADHVEFLKQILINARRASGTSRVILFGIPRINLNEVATAIAAHTKQIVINECDLLALLQNVDSKRLTPEIKAQCIQYLTRQPKMYEYGWILVGCIKNIKEAKQLIAKGVIPTHVLHLVASFQPTLEEPLYCNVPVYWPQIRRMIQDMRTAFKKQLKEVHLLDHSLQDVVKECVETLKIKKAAYVIKPRILLIGPRGSGRKTQAQILAEKMKIVHIDFDRYLCEVWKQNTENGEKMRSCKDPTCNHSELLANIINKRTLEEDCLVYGWVLTGFPFTDRDLKFLDTIETPPNRIIFLEIELSICKDRLVNQRYNVYTGSVTDLDMVNPDEKIEKTLKIHPKDEPQVVDMELSRYCENYGDIKKYCGNTAYYINANQDIRVVHENITSIIASAPNPTVPRKGIYVDSDSCICSDICVCSPIPSCTCLGPCRCGLSMPPFGHDYKTP